MNQLLKWMGILAAVVAGMVLLALLAVYALSERTLRRTHDVPATAIHLPSDERVVEEGARLAALRGCTGCHAADLGGGVFFDAPRIARLTAPNLTTLVREYSTAEFVRAVRHGVNREGRGLAGMPSAMFTHLTDADLGAIIAWIRSLPVVDRALPPREIRIMGRIGLVTGLYALDSGEIDHTAPRQTVDTLDVLAFGRYLAMTSCTECHGQDLRGNAENLTPGLAVVAGYSLEAFRHLMQTGEALGGRELELMSDVARSRFSQFTDAELVAVHTYLRALAAPP